MNKAEFEAALEPLAVRVVNLLEHDPIEVMGFLADMMRDAPDDESRLLLMRAVEAEVVKRNPSEILERLRANAEQDYRETYRENTP